MATLPTTRLTSVFFSFKNPFFGCPLSGQWRSQTMNNKFQYVHNSFAMIFLLPCVLVGFEPEPFVMPLRQASRASFILARCGNRTLNLLFSVFPCHSGCP
jgi:hypothetical protein